MLRICARIVNLHIFVVYANYLNMINMEQALLEVDGGRLSYFGNC